MIVDFESAMSNMLHAECVGLLWNASQFRIILHCESLVNVFPRQQQDNMTGD